MSIYTLHVSRLNQAITKLQSRGKIVIKPEIQTGGRWDSFIRHHAEEEPKLPGIVLCTFRILKGLTDGKSPREAWELRKGYGLSLFAAGFVARIVGDYAPRGEEFRSFWNGKFGYSGEGTVYPAVICINREP